MLFFLVEKFYENAIGHSFGTIDRIKSNKYVMQEIRALFQSVYPLSAEAETALLQNWQKTVQLRRNDFLIRMEQTESYLYFIKSGMLKICIEIDDSEVIVGFGYDNSLICSFPSFINQTPSGYTIQALIRTDLLAIHRTDFFRLLDTHPSLHHCWRRMMEQTLIGRMQRETDLLTQSPAERIQRLLERSPHIFQLVPHKYLASYLRMTPETFSRHLNS